MAERKIITPFDEVPKDAVWRVISCNVNYEISNYGHCRRATPGSNSRIGKILIPSRTGGKRYPKYILSKDRKAKTYTAHRLVALAFIPNLYNHEYVLHCDGNMDNCHVSNLRWGTAAENTMDAVRHGTFILENMSARFPNTTGENHPQTLLTAEDVVWMRTTRTKAEDIAKKYGLSVKTVRSILCGSTWKSITPLRSPFLRKSRIPAMQNKIALTQGMER